VEATATRSPVGAMLTDALPVTVSPAAGGAALWLLVGVAGGVVGATRVRSRLDRGITILVLIGHRASGPRSAARW